MKTYTFFNKTVLLLSLASFAACSSDEDAEQVQNDNNNSTQPFKQLVFSASIQDDESTRAALSGNNMVWEKDEQITVFNSESKTTTLSIKSGDAGKTTATFSNTTTLPDDFVQASGCYYSITPYDATKSSISGGVVTSSIPDIQTVTSGYAYDKSALQMIACADVSKREFAFKNVAALAKFTIKNNDGTNKIKYIKIVAHNTANKISGGYTATLTLGEDPVITNTSTAYYKNSVELKNIASTKDEKEYYIALLPGTLDQGFTIYFETEFTNNASGKGQSIAQFVKKTSYKFERSKVYDFGTFDASALKYRDNVVDLGLPSGTLWTTKNIGGYSNGKDALFTTYVYDYGQYYAWGEDFGYEESTQQTHNNNDAPVANWTSTPTTKTKYNSGYIVGSKDWTGLTSKDRYRWDTYKWCTRYSLTSDSDPSDSEVIKYKSTGLTLSKYDDVAWQKSGGKYCMPTKVQMEELLNTTYMNYKASSENAEKYSTSVSKYGVKFASKRYSSRFIWLSAGGAIYGTGNFITDDLQYDDSNIYYWSRTLTSSSRHYAHCIDWPYTTNEDTKTHISSDRRYSGRAIRAVVTNEAIAPTVGDPDE